jgi:Skp family chaperone for outer membrane proteins
MKTLIFSIAVGSFLLTAALPAAARPAAPAALDVQVQLIADDSTPADRGTYVQRAKDEMQEWNRKIQDFGTKTGDAAKRDLAKAKASADRAAQKLENASARGWESAKRGFERASRKLSDTWHRINPADK